MHRLALGALTLAALWLSACGAGEPAVIGGSTGSEDTTPPTTAVSTPEAQVLYEADTDRARAGRGPSSRTAPSCASAAALLPSVQCGGMPIANWDWDAVEGEESADGTTWGSYHVVGTVEGGILTVTEIGPYDPEADAFAGGSHTWPRCPEPAGGWVDVDPGLASEEDYAQGVARARRLPGHVATWTRYVGDPTSEEMMRLEEEGKPLPQKILHVAVTRGRRRRRDRHPRGLGWSPLHPRTGRPYGARAGGDPEGGRGLHRGRAGPPDGRLVGRRARAWPPRSSSGSTPAERARPPSTSATASGWSSSCPALRPVESP